MSLQPCIPLFYSDEEIISACRQVLAANGLHDWRVEINKRFLRTQGHCSKIGKVICLRGYDFRDFAHGGVNRSMVMDLIFHEVAHALTPVQRVRYSTLARTIKRKQGGLPRYRLLVSPRTSWQRAQHNIVWARNAVKLGCTPEFASCARERAMLSRALGEVRAA